MKLSNNHWDNTEDDQRASSEDHDERDQIEWEKFEPAISFKALAWGAGLTIAVILLGLKVYSLFQR